MKNILVFIVLILGIKAVSAQIRETTLYNGVNASIVNEDQQFIDIKYLYVNKYGCKYNLLIYDNEQVDNDVVMIDRGNGYVDYIVIRNNPTIISFSVKRNQPFTVKISAQNEGNIPPCTIALRIEGFTEQIVMNMRKGESKNLVIQKKE